MLSTPQFDDPACQLLDQLRNTPEIFSRLQSLSGGELHRQAVLRKEFSPELVRAACELGELRHRAQAKFTRASEMWLGRKSLEQSTGEIVANYKAQRFTRPTLDLCCGMGGDAIAIAKQAAVTIVDLVPANLLQALWNAEIYGVASNISARQADVLELNEAHWGDQLIHIDPDRRADDRGKMVRVEDYVPGLPFLLSLKARSRGGAIKVGPASNFGGKFPGVETELISVAGECKEATLWYGELAGSSAYRATVLPACETIAGHPLDAETVVTPLGAYIYDPDPAVVRSGLVDVLCEKLGLTRLDDAEEYLTSDELVNSPFVTPFRVLAETPNNERDIRDEVRRQGWGQVEIKCRHVPTDANKLRKKLPLDGTSPGVIFVARLDGKTRVVYALRG